MARRVMLLEAMAMGLPTSAALILGCPYWLYRLVLASAVIGLAILVQSIPGNKLRNGWYAGLSFGVSRTVLDTLFFYPWLANNEALVPSFAEKSLIEIRVFLFAMDLLMAAFFGLITGLLARMTQRVIRLYRAEPVADAAEGVAPAEGQA
jgi:hypothetical protein